MNLIVFKFLAAILIGLAAVIAGFLPIRATSIQRRFFTLGDSFASGIFLGAGAFHMLPEAISTFNKIHLKDAYPISLLLCLGGILFFVILERSVMRFNKLNHQQHHPIIGYLLALVLSIHSLVEGAALGINMIFTDAFLIFIAIIAHKGSASFALSMTLRQSNIKPFNAGIIIILFSLMTPIGISITSLLVSSLEDHSGRLLQASFNAFAAGTFLYIGGIRLVHGQFKQIRENFGDMSALICGLFLMIGLSFII